MSNTTDFIQPECDQLAVPAARAAVFLDGALCEDLEPVEIVRSGWPEFGWARLAYHPSTAAVRSLLGPGDSIEDRFALGQTICVCRLPNAGMLQTITAGLELFTGQIETIETRITGNGEQIEIVARDASAVLRRITVYGQRVLQDDGTTVRLDGLETVFNPLGEDNAAPQPVTRDGAARTVFCARPSDADLWTCAAVIQYLLCEYLPAGMLRWPDSASLLVLTEGRSVRDLDLTGLDLLEALHRCAEEAGLQFQFVPGGAESGPGQALVFYRAGNGRTVELDCQPAGETLHPARTNIGALHSTRNFYPVTHRYIGQGDFRVYEATFELVRAWDPDRESIDYGTFCAATNPQFHEVKDVYRKWCLNEAGDYTAAPYLQGPAYDLARIFEHRPWVRRRRRFWPALSTNAQGEPLGYFLQASFDYGLHWWQYRYAFNLLHDECGVWLSSDQLDLDTWVAAVKGLLRFRITASVVSDKRLTCTVADGPVGAAIPVVDHILTLPRRFQYRKVSPQSLLTSTCAPQEVDDTAALYAFVRQQATAAPAVIETFDVQTPMLLAHFQPGDRVVCGPESRDLLQYRRDNRSTISIGRVHMDFCHQRTNLRLIRRRMLQD